MSAARETGKSERRDATSNERRDSASNRLVLALDTATAPGGVAVGSGGDVHAEVVLEEAPRHSAMVLPAIEDALRAAGASMRDVGAVVVGTGPGSFTGVRIAAATAKGLVHARGLPLHGHSSLLAAAFAAGLDGRAVCALFDARRQEAYAGCWRMTDDELETLLAPMAGRVQDVARDMREYASLYIGDGAQRNRDIIERAGGTVGALHAGQHCARALLALHARAGGTDRIADPRQWQPTYIRPPNVTLPK